MWLPMNWPAHDDCAFIRSATEFFISATCTTRTRTRTNADTHTHSRATNDDYKFDPHKTCANFDESVWTASHLGSELLLVELGAVWDRVREVAGVLAHLHGHGFQFIVITVDGCVVPSCGHDQVILTTKTTPLSEGSRVKEDQTTNKLASLSTCCNELCPGQCGNVDNDGGVEVP